MAIKCIIVDDEPLAIDLLKGYAERTPYLELSGTYCDAETAFKALDDTSIQLIFLDIHMPGISGIEMARNLSSRLKVIFTTAYDHYAIEGFRVNALDYLLKPVSYEEFLKATMKAAEWFNKVPADSKDSLFVKTGYRIEKVRYEDILYIENKRDYVEFNLRGDTGTISSLMNISTLEEQLPGNIFMRVHRSFIVNLNHVDTIERSRIVYGRNYIPVSDTYRDRFMEFVKERFFNE